MDLGRAEVVDLPLARDRAPLEPHHAAMADHACAVTLRRFDRDQFMARHKANHIQVVYANSPKEADAAMLAKAAMADAMGIEVSICGTRKNGKGWD